MTPISLPVRDWFRAAPARIARPHHVPRATAVNRFNDGSGTYAVFYCAPDAVTALLEARALLGQPHSSAAGVTHDTWRVFRYRIDLGPAPVVDLGSPNERSAAGTNTQELTGDWERRRNLLGSRPGIEHVRHNTAQAPTQRLASDLFGRTPSVVGLVAPSARMPSLANLALFVSRIPVGSVVLNGQRDIVI